MNSETKLFLGIIFVTIVGIIGAAFVFSRPTTVKPANPEFLMASDSHRTGSPSATVTMVEFGDFQCPACSAYHTVVSQIMERNKETLSLVFRNFPLDSHANAMPAAKAAEAAGMQGKFWQMYDLLYTTQRDWTPEKDPKALFTQYAKDLGLDLDMFSKDMESDEVRKRIDKDIRDANALGVNATPTFYVNGEKIANPASMEDFEALIKAAAKKAPTPMASNDAAYHVHANIKAMVDGKVIDFSQDKYQSKEGKELNEYIHFHDGNGSVLHIHKKGMKLTDLFSSLGMAFTNDCLVTDTKQSYCSGNGKTLKLYVNGTVQSNPMAYAPQDLDRMLLYYGIESESLPQSALQSVADDACIYSEKCPERGTPPSEECVGGLGTDCK